MLISLTHRFVFISNTKTASTSLEHALDIFSEIRARGGASEKHVVWQKARADYGFLFDHPDYAPESFFRFGVIRDPLSWFVSWYNFRLTVKGDALPEGMTLREFWQKDDWVKWRKQEGGKVKRLQKAHFLDEDGQCRFDLVLPMDMLNEYAPLLFARLGVNTSLPKMNVSRERESVDNIPEDLAAEIRAFWAEDYAFMEEMRVRAKNALCPVMTEAIPDPDLKAVSDLRLAGADELWLAGTTRDLRGRAVPAPGLPADARLVLKHPRGDRDVVWGLPSPTVAAKHTDNPRAENSRFQLDGMDMRAGESAELVLMASGQAPVVLVRFRADPEAPVPQVFTGKWARKASGDEKANKKGKKGKRAGVKARIKIGAGKAKDPSAQAGKGRSKGEAGKLGAGKGKGKGKGTFKGTGKGKGKAGKKQATGGKAATT